VDRIINIKSSVLRSAVVNAYLDEGINLGKAAELLDMHALELQEKFLTQGIPIRHGVDTLEEAHAEVAAILQWNMAVSRNDAFQKPEIL